MRGRKRRRQPVVTGRAHAVCAYSCGGVRRAWQVRGCDRKQAQPQSPSAASTAGPTRQGRTPDPATTSAARAKPMAVVYESFDRVTLRWQLGGQCWRRRRVLGGGFVGGGECGSRSAEDIEAERRPSIHSSCCSASTARQRFVNQPTSPKWSRRHQRMPNQRYDHE